jgi:hypothetical protein
VTIRTKGHTDDFSDPAPVRHEKSYRNVAAPKATKPTEGEEQTEGEDKDEEDEDVEEEDEDEDEENEDEGEESELEVDEDCDDPDPAKLFNEVSLLDSNLTYSLLLSVRPLSS